MAHTPGPWHTDGELSGYREPEVYAPDANSDYTVHIATVCWNDGGRPVAHNANATLIAAAPELLAALESLPNYEPRKTYFERMAAWYVEAVVPAVCKAKGK